MKIHMKERTRIGASLLAASLANPSWIGADSDRAAYAWHLAQTYCDLAEAKAKERRHPLHERLDD